MTTKAVKQMSRKARRKGWKVQPTKGGHVRIEGPDGGLVFTASTPSDFRGERNNLARLAKQGLELRDGQHRRTEQRPEEEPPVPVEMRDRLLESLTKMAASRDTGQGIWYVDIAEDAGISRTSASSKLVKMAKDGMIRRVSAGWYRPLAEPEPIDLATSPAIDNGAVRANGNGNGNGHQSVGVVSVAEPAVASVPQVDVRPVVEQPLAPLDATAIPKRLPPGVPELFELVTADDRGRPVLRDDTGHLWLAVPLIPKL